MGGGIGSWEVFCGADCTSLHWEAIAGNRAIWWVTPDALQVWLDHSAFGKERQNEGYKSAEEQDKKLQEALVEMGFQ